MGELRPVLLIYDGHSTHVDNRVVTLAQENDITILKLPPHTSHILQPLDLAVFRSFKTSWDEELVTWQRHNQGKKLPKKIFSAKVRNVWNNINPAVILNGFKKAGISPFNSTVISKEKYHPEALKRFENINQTNANKTEIQNSEIIDKDISEAGPSDENIVVMEDDEEQPEPNNVSFEDLLLQTVKQSAPNPKVSKKRVAAGAEVITRRAVDQQLYHIKKSSIDTLKKRRTRNQESTSSESSIEPVYEESDNDLNFLDEEQVEEDDTSENVKLNAYVLVKYCTKKTIKYFAGHIIKINKDKRNYLVKYLKFNRVSNNFFWPTIDDTDTIIFENIEMFLPDPINDQRNNSYKFEVEFSALNVC